MKFQALNEYKFYILYENKGKMIEAHISSSGVNQHDARTKIERGIAGSIVYKMKCVNETINWI